jgi:hypothetical protein
MTEATSGRSSHLTEPGFWLPHVGEVPKMTVLRVLRRDVAMSFSEPKRRRGLAEAMEHELESNT